MIKKIECRCEGSTFFYEIELQSSLLNQEKILSEFLRAQANSLAIITDANIAPSYGELLLNTLSEAGLSSHLFSIPAGEGYKTRQTKEILEDRLLEKSLGRDTCIIALGGGVITDIAGFLAATYCRGIPLVMIPTTLLAMVDASIGGKNGINTQSGKNLIGSIYQPQKVWIDPSLLVTLPKKEFGNGVVEMIKHGLIADRAHFEFLEDQSAGILSLDPDCLEKAILDSARIKKEHVEQDAKEKGLRRLLNFGHTVGHALESQFQYVLAHGEAVAIGMLVEIHMMVQMDLLKPQILERVLKILKSYQIPLKLPSSVEFKSLLQYMIPDKKSCKGVPRFVHIRDIGVPIAYDDSFCTAVDEKIIENAIQWMNYDLCCY